MSGQSGLELPLTSNVTVPLGVTEVKATPASCAVKVTAVLTLVELEGEALTPSVAASALTVWVAVPAVATVKLLSPE
jgi:hypothetical protein